jgi:hypothetical protein
MTRCRWRLMRFGWPGAATWRMRGRSLRRALRRRRKSSLRRCMNRSSARVAGATRFWRRITETAPRLWFGSPSMQTTPELKSSKRGARRCDAFRQCRQMATPTDDAIALSVAWRVGEAWRHPAVCDKLQRAWLRRVRRAVNSGTRTSFVQRWGRQVGKSWACIAFALCEMQRRPGIIVRYAALTGKSCAAIVVPTFEALRATMPDDVRPVLSEQKGTITAPNGSTMVFAGTDNEQFDRLRGPKAHLIMLDESAFYADLEAVERALLPQLNTTNGLTLYFSSPPESSAHPWVQRDAAAQARGNWSRATIYDSPRYSPEAVAAIERAEAERLGLTVEALKTTTYWRREFEALIVTEEQRAALPAWTDEAAAELVGDWVRPEYFDGYVGADVGRWGDPHFGFLGYHDPATNTFTVEHELEMRSAPTHIGGFVDEMRRLEREAWGVNRWEGTLYGVTREDIAQWPEHLRYLFDEGAPRQPYLRVGDDDARLVIDVRATHGYGVVPAQKADKYKAVDDLNQRIRERRWRVHRRCVRTIEQYRSTLWNRSRSEWERTERDHGDAVDVSLYVQRAIRWHRDCRPPTPLPPELTASMPRKPTPQGWTGVFRR